MPKEPLLRKGFLVLLSLLFISNLSFAQSNKEKLQILDSYQTKKMKRLSKNYEQQYKKQKQKAIEKAKEEGWIIRKRLKNGQFIELQGLNKNGQPLYFITNNADAASTISTNEVWNGGSADLNLTGDGMTIGEWDGDGVLTSHQEFNDQGSSRVTQVDSPGETNDHSTHVAGTMIAAGVDTKAKGMAHEASLNAYDWNSDDSEMIDAALNGLLISNHSYGYAAGWSGDIWHGTDSISTEEDYRFGFYGKLAARWDSIAYELPYYLIAKASGNDRGDGSGQTTHPQDGGANGYDCIGYRGNAKNILTVGAIDDLPSGYTGDPSDVTIADFSSRGPADDGRIKPDICGNGINLYSPDNVNNSSYMSISGTSMATPNVAGSLLLLQEHWNETQGNYMKSATLKGLVIHTANEAGTNDGPDYKFGWGVMNTQKAAEAISNRDSSTRIEEDTLNEGETRSISIDAAGAEPLVVTVCWTDPAGTPTAPKLDPTTPMLVNDLDLKVSDGSTTHYPYKLDPQNPSNAATKGDNNVDNVEKVVIESPSQSSYTIEISHEGTLKNGEQSFSLIVSGLYTGYPSVATDSIYNISQTAAEVDAKVIDEGDSEVSERGIVYSKSKTPTLNDHVITKGSGAGSYTCSLNNLAVGTTYFIRAYAINSQGTSYSEELSFTTKCGLIDTLPYRQDFSSGTLPNCWENIDNAGTGEVWAFNNPGNRDTDTIKTSTVNNGFAILDSDYYGNSNQDADLVTPEFNLAYYDSVTLSFEHVYNDYESETATIAYSTDGGSSWTKLQSWSGSDTEIPAIFNKNLTAEVAGEKEVKFKWNYTGSFGWYWAVDDIHLTGVMIPTASIKAIPGCGSGNGSIRVSSDKPGPQTFYLCDEYGSTLQTWTGDTTAHKFTDLSNDNYSAKVVKNGNTSNLTSFVTLKNSTNSPTKANSVSASRTDICEGSSIRLSYSGGSGYSFKWYAGTCGENLVGTGNDLTVYPDTSTTYYGRWENGCGVTSCLSVSISVTPLPDKPENVTADSTTICKGGSTELMYSGGSGKNFVWYTDGCGTNQFATGNNISLSPDSTTTFHGRWENSCGASDCDSVTIQVDPIPSNPVSISASSTTICEGTNTRLSYTGGSGGSFEWYSGSCGGTHVGTGDELTVSPTTTTTYYGRWESICDTTSCKSIQITVNPLPDPPTSVNASSQNILEGESVELSYNGGSGDTFKWYSRSCDGSLVGSGNNISVSPTSTTTYYGKWINSCGESQCGSVTVQVEQTVSTPKSLSATEDTICSGSSTRLSYTGGSGETFRWFSGSCGGTIVGTGNNITITPSETTTYYGRWENSYGESECKNITITVDQAAESPRSIESSFTSICQGTTTRLSYVGGTGSKFKWYKDSCGGTYVGSGNDVTVSPDKNTVYFGRWESNCEVSSCDSIHINIKDSTYILQHPEEKLVKEGERTSFSVDTKGANLTYTWRKNGSELSDTAGYSGSSTGKLLIDPVEATHEGSYDVIITGDCGDTKSDAVSLTIEATAIKQASKDDIQIYPNPTSGKITIRGEKLIGAELSIMNLLGEQIIRQKIKNKVNEIELGAYPEGIYFIRIGTKENRISKKIIVK
jgi:hypothetical protein